jgi:rhodanese-related sulfurtransferase
MEITEIAFINPLYPPILGDSIISGGHPQTLGRKNPAPLFQQAIMRMNQESKGRNMKYTKITGIILIIGVLCAMLVSCGNSSPAATAGPAANNTANDTVNEFEVIRAAADKFLASGRAEDYLMSKDLHDVINDSDPNNDPRIMETRNNQNYTLGHICGSVSIPWHQLFLTLSPGSMENYFWEHDALSTGKKVAIVSYTGQEGGGLTLAALNMLGWDAYKIKWGYNQWQFCPLASPGAFLPASTGIGRMTGLNTSGAVVQGLWAIGENYPTETTPNTPTQTYNFPVINNTDSADTFEIIRAAANKIAQSQATLTEAELAEGGSEQKHKWVSTDMIPVDVLSSMNGSTPPFLLSVQPRDLYDKGHIKGAVWMDLKTICQPENLKLLPTNRKIVVVSNDGHSGNTVSAILNMLGYNTTNLLFGMMAWTESDEIVSGRFNVYTEDMVTLKDVLSYEICWIDTPNLEMLPQIEGYVPPVLAPSEDPNDALYQ